MPLDPAALARQRRLNRVQSALILLGLTALAGVTGLLVAGPEGLVVAATLALVFMLMSPAPGGTMFRYAYGAIRLSPAQAPDIFALVAALARRAGLERVPELHLIPSGILQAMATGNRAEPALAVTLGLLQTLPSRELAAVLAHEVAHIRHGDISVMRLAASAASLTRVMATVGIVFLMMLLPSLWVAGIEAAPSPFAPLLLFAAPVLGDLLVLSLSRRREFLADAGAVELTGDAEALVSALTRISRLQGDDWERLLSRGPRWLRWITTHPSLSERITRLKAMAPPPRPDLMRPGDWQEDELAPLRHLVRNRPAQRLAHRWLL